MNVYIMGIAREEHFECLQNGNINDQEGEVNEFSNSNEDLCPIKCTTLQNVRDALCVLKNHKAPAADSIPTELLKYGGNKVINAINNLITIIWGLEQIPDEWKKN